MNNINKVHLGDCLDVMESIEDKSINTILCDLPYGTIRCKWDIIIPFEPLWKQYKRIIKDKGVIILTSTQPFTSNINMFRYDWVWKKPQGTGHLNAKYQSLRDKEDILIFYKNRGTYNPQFMEGNPYKPKAGKDKTSTSSSTESYNLYNNIRYINEGKRYPRQVVEFNTVQRDTLHPTQKPVELFEYFIKTYSNENDLILDNCCGSTTAIACINLNRNFILKEKNSMNSSYIEKEEKYFKISEERIEKHRNKNN